MQELACEGLRSDARVLETTGWDQAYLTKFLGAVRECEATVQAWLAAGRADAAGSGSAGSGRQRRVRAKEKGEQVEVKHKEENVEDEEEHDGVNVE